MGNNFPQHDGKGISHAYPHGATMDKILAHELRAIKAGNPVRPVSSSAEASGPDAE